MPGFDRIAPLYDFLAALFSFNSIWRSQSYFIPQLKKNSSVLILGGGTGRILEALDKQRIIADCAYVELSAEMIERAKRRQGERGKTQFIHGSYDQIPNRTFDIIITPYILDCFGEEELQEVMKTLDQHLAPGGKWLFTDFVKEGWITRSLYFFFRMIGALTPKRLPVFAKHFTALGYTIETEKYFFFGQLVTRVCSRQ